MAKRIKEYAVTTIAMAVILGVLVFWCVQAANWRGPG